MLTATDDSSVKKQTAPGYTHSAAVACGQPAATGAGPRGLSGRQPGSTGGYWLLGLLACAVSFIAAAQPTKKLETPVIRTILDLQAQQHSSRLAIRNLKGRTGIATLIELNPRINSWYLLRLDWTAPAEQLSYHLENPKPGEQFVKLTAAGIRLSATGHKADCSLWSNAAKSELEQAKASSLAYAPLCEHRLYLRNRVPGTQTQIERATDFLRDRVWGGDRIVTFVKDQFYKDAFLETARPLKPIAPEVVASPEAPVPARLSAALKDSAIIAENQGLDIGSSLTALGLGRWYALHHNPGMYLSAIQPLAIAPEVLAGHPQLVNPLDAIESSAVDYLVAFDLSKFDLGFTLGTDHPRLSWSERTLDQVRNPALPGPDGIGHAAPLVTNGMVSPALLPRVAAAFTAGFKREHSAFHYGPLALRNAGSHYGFIEEGVVFSKLQPGLATLYVLDDGSIGMKTWTAADNALLPAIKHARQNGAPLIEYDALGKLSSPGTLVKHWGAGNWGGSKDEKQRTLRAGACLQQTATRRFLIYGYFSTATPSAMVRVFEAYGCHYAMHLDMNALEHTYLAVYTRQRGELLVQHLIDEMAVVDKKGGNQLAPRFLSFADDRDFFYLTRREQPR